MVINRKEIKRKRKVVNSDCNLLNETPKRTKVHAQRKFAQGSNVSSPVITPVKEIEKQDKPRLDVLPEPQELLSMNRPHTEDFLTFLCFRGTSMLPPNLNFFNTATMDSRTPTLTIQKEPITVCPPIASINTRSSVSSSERPFIAFGVRKRADPILVSKHMDKKRRHALALQALRRKYQEQKMAKIRAVTISKLSEKVTSKSVVRTRSITKNETTKKSLPQKTRVKIISTKHVKVTTRSSIKTPLRTNFTTPMRSTIQKKMCLRSFRGRFIQRELTIKKSKKKNTTKIIKKVKTKQTREISSEFSSDDDQPLKSFKVNKTNKVVTKRAAVSKKPIELGFRVTRAHPVLVKSNDPTFIRKIHMTKSLHSKTPYVKLTSSKLPKQLIQEKQSHGEKNPKFHDKVLHLRTRKIEAEKRVKVNVDVKKKLQETESKVNIKEDKVTEKKVNKVTREVVTPEKNTKVNIKEDKVTEKKVNKVTKEVVTPEKNTKVNIKEDKVTEKKVNKVIKEVVTPEKNTKDLKKQKEKPKPVKKCESPVKETEKKVETNTNKSKPKPKFTKLSHESNTMKSTIDKADKLRVILEKDIASSICEKEVPKVEVCDKVSKSKTDKTDTKKPKEITPPVDVIQVKPQIPKDDISENIPKPDVSIPKENVPKDVNLIKTDIKTINEIHASTPVEIKNTPEPVKQVKNKVEIPKPSNTDKELKQKVETNEKNRCDKTETNKNVRKSNVEGPRVSQRPSRKTKEAAAIYMEILGHKLVNEEDFDDDNISIDSFPELPNVRKTEQRENELKAKAKSKHTEINAESVKSTEIQSKKIKLDPIENESKPTKVEEIKTKENEIVPLKNKEIEIVSDSDTLVKKVEDPSPTKRVTRGSKLVVNTTLSDSEESVRDNVEKKLPIKVKAKKTKDSNKLKKRLGKPLESESDSDESTTSKITKVTKIKSLKAVDNSFSDSDEEPLSKLTQNKIEKTTDLKDDKPKNVEVKKDEKLPESESALTLSGKPKRECTKRPQNYLPLFSSSEDEEKYFHCYLKKQNKIPKTQTKCVATASADLLCKDVDKRFGKGKVNMSTEQIEQWLKDSALAGSAIKKDNEIFKFEEKLANFDTDLLQLKPEVKKIEPESPEKIETTVETPTKPKEEEEVVASESSKCDQSSVIQTNLKHIERKMIFRKERKIPIPKVNAFSANNESSVYAFEADNEDIISTPFRRPSRRPSSTGTSRSEDSSKYEELSKNAMKFRYPPLKNDTIKSNKQEVSLMLSADESNASTSIAVQLDLNTAEVVNPENSIQANREDGDQLFYIPLQPGKQSSQVIQGVAVKLGTKGASGPNQKVVMSAKLITHAPSGVQKVLEKPTSMYPPPIKTKASDVKMYTKHASNSRSSDHSEEIKYKIPSSPSASSSSSTKVTKRQQIKTRIRPLEFCNPVVSNEFPSADSPAIILEAPTFYPNDKEFQDPLEYIEKIRHHAEKFGICRIVPPSHFKPECKVSDDMRFTAYNQYVHKMLHRWGPNFKELMAIKKYLETQNIILTHPPWIGGMEIDLPRLYQIVQSLGGLKEVIEKKKWPKVSELMKIPKSAQDRVTKLDDIYCKYLLPYDTLSPAERDKLFDEVETEWAKRESKALLKSQQKIAVKDNNSNSSDAESNDDESDECIVKGRSMALNAFYRIARNTMSMWFKTTEPTAQEVEQEFWRHVTTKQSHICVHSGSIDSGSWGYGFAVSKNSPFARHAWNLKVLTNNSASVLRSMGPVMGVTVPTLHVGMVFSACCWYRDPHSLPWIEYLHTGGNKIWYAIPDSMSESFRSTLIKLVPNYCRNKSLWLPSDTAMVPPSVLVENGVSLCRTIQEPGQFIVVFPKAFTSSLCTGYVVSESVYFAPLSWLKCAETVFRELQHNCEPSMFSLEKLIISVATDSRSSIDVLRLIIPIIESLCATEKLGIEKLEKLGLNNKERIPLPDASLKKRKKFQTDSGDYECEACSKNLFISWVINSQDDSVYCLEHTIKYLEEKELDSSNCKLLFTYNNEELIGLIEKVKNTIEAKLQKKVIGKNN
ncbi:hypothetical protein RN001_010242 [Aquatica leii]|uniref:Protein Jumonji n=1 Tax=Aquatica leii TaxID=1421715 RepID=A0AAN7P962_9COLE|nr:hypothetical protein RN001_010242 [Aquatica leii]